MENKTEINCPNCNQKVRIPRDKHVRFTCPNCSNEFEIDNRVKEVSKKSSYNWIYYSILGGLLFWVFNYYTTKKDSNIETNPNLNTEHVNSENQSQNSNTSNYQEYDKNLAELTKAIDISNETTNDFAVRLASKFPGEYNIGQICQIYDYIVRNWKYVNDSDKMENFRSASRTIKNNFSGDCDDFAILLAALIESIGGDARVSFAYNDE
jgi:transglutaminase-like putative cysteine protease